MQYNGTHTNLKQQAAYTVECWLVSLCMCFLMYEHHMVHTLLYTPSYLSLFSPSFLCLSR